MNCPSCGAAMHLKPDMESFRCDYCKSVYFPDKNADGVRVLDEQSDKNCPICKIPLVHAAIDKIRILYCKGCLGMLIPMPIFQNLVAELEETQGGGTLVDPAADFEDLSHKIDCPQCHHRMDTHFYAGPGKVVIESCEDCCLVWLDRGELMRIVRAANGTIPYSEPLPGDSDGPPYENPDNQPNLGFDALFKK
jgi:Zn-finger nucleic acid-binding protein